MRHKDDIASLLPPAVAHAQIQAFFPEESFSLSSPGFDTGRMVGWFGCNCSRVALEMLCRVLYISGTCLLLSFDLIKVKTSHRIDWETYPQDPDSNNSVSVFASRIRSSRHLLRGFSFTDPELPAGHSSLHVAQVSASLLPVKHLNSGKKNLKSLDKLNSSVFILLLSWHLSFNPHNCAVQPQALKGKSKLYPPGSTLRWAGGDATRTISHPVISSSKFAGNWGKKGVTHGKIPCTQQ